MGLLNKKKKERKKLKDTKVGQFLKEKAPDILDKVGDLLPDNGVYGIVKNLISKDDKIPPSLKEEAYDLIELDKLEQQNISERWSYDMASDNSLSKNVRPLILIYTWILLTVIFVLKWCNVELPENYVQLYTTLALAVNAAYFGARTIEKYHSKKYTE